MKLDIPKLFEDGEFERRKNLEQKDFENENRRLLLFFQRQTYVCHEKTRNLLFSEFQPSEMDKNQFAVTMSSYLRQAIIRNFPEYCSLATKSRFKLTTPSHDYIYIKKLYADKRPSNVETLTNSLIIYQLTEDNKDKGSNVFLGYTITDDNSIINGVYAVCIDGEEIVWQTDLSNLRGDNLEADSSDAPLVPFSTPSAPKLKPGAVPLRRKMPGDKDHQ